MRAAGPHGLVDHFFRHESGRLVAVLVRRFGATHLAAIEDAVQGALAAALSTWLRDGIPDNPSAWLTRVAKNRVIDHLRREARLGDELPDEGHEIPPPVAFTAEIDDDELRMLFVCCDPALPPRSQLVLALKLLCGFSAREVAARLFITVANTEKILSRGRARLREHWEGKEWATPPAEELATRRDAVQAVIYLLFNEGYSSQRENEVIRRELCEEALRLGRRLLHPSTEEPAAWALVALMHFHLARLDARLDAEGGLLMLEEQDRSRWDRAQIQQGLVALSRAARGERFSRYHAEAAILAEHCLAPSYAKTNWSEIVELYAMLEQIAPSPLHTMNRAIAVAESDGPEAGLALLETLTPPTWLVRYYLWDATLGELHRRAGHHERARRYLERARDAAPTAPERAVFVGRLERCTKET